MDSGVQANITLLRQHTDYLADARRLSMQLADQLHLAWNLAPVEEKKRFASIIQKTENLSRYFAAMMELVDRMSAELANTSRATGAILDANRHMTRSITQVVFLTDDSEL